MNNKVLLALGLWFGLPALCSAASHAGSATLVADLTVGYSPGSADVRLPMARAGSRVAYFSNWFDGVRFETTLAASDGTAAGTSVIGAPCGGGGVFQFGFSGETADLALFLIQCMGDPSRRLWKTDGTPQGTAEIWKADASEGIAPAVSIGGNRFVFATCDLSSCRLHKSDGTAEGTTTFADLDSFSLATDCCNGPAMLWTGSRLFFTSRLPGAPPELWTSDLTPSGTVRLLKSTSAVVYTGLTKIGTRVYFAGDAPHGAALWTSDGTIPGTHTITSPGLWVDSVALAVSDKLYFMGQDAAGRELWAANTTTGAISRLSNASDFFFVHSSLHRAGLRAVFSAQDNAGVNRLWSTNGAPLSAVPLTGCPAGCPTVAELTGSLGQRAIFTAVDKSGSPSLWSTDGTGAGTTAIHPACPGGSVVPVLAGTSVLYATRGCGRTGLWISDGSSAGTRQLNNAMFSALGAAVAAGHTTIAAVLRVQNGELWATRGTPSTTAPVAELVRQRAGTGAGPLAALGNGVVFRACGESLRAFFALAAGQSETLPINAVCGGLPDDPPIVTGGRAFFTSGFRFNEDVWATDGTTAGTTRLTHISDAKHELFILAGKLVFLRGFPNFESSLWSSDGTTQGTDLLAEIPPTPTDPRLIGILNSTILYVGRNHDGTNELWATDGAPLSFRKLRTLVDTTVPEGERAVAFGNRNLFRTGFETSSFALWVTDGTAAGTVPLTGAAPGEGLGVGRLTLFQGRLFFFASHAGKRALWSTDGTPAGTRVEVEPPSGTTFEDAGTVFDGHLYFIANDAEHGRELWRTDGSPGGTDLFADIVPGPPSSLPHELVATGDTLFFVASDAAGTELWETDGTESGTALVQDISPGASSSYPEHLTVGGDHLYFSADDSAHGREIWSLPLDNPGCTPTGRALCLNDGRFRVETFWRDFQGNTGEGQAHPLTGDTGYFWFFDPANVELVTKVLDGRGVNDHFWTFSGALSSVLYHVTVTDQQTGAARRYYNPAGVLGSLADTSAFGTLFDSNASALQTTTTAPQTTRATANAAVCVATATRLCLRNRFAVEIAWKDFQGNTGAGQATSLTTDTGYFWFFNAGNVEVVLKVLDGRALNGKFWVFYGALSTVEYTITVTDTETGATRVYKNRAGNLASVADTGAL